jgi:hypothetical protein
MDSKFENDRPSTSKPSTQKNTGQQVETLTGTSAQQATTRRRGRDLLTTKRHPTKEVASPVLRFVALKGRTDIDREAPQPLQ